MGQWKLWKAISNRYNQFSIGTTKDHKVTNNTNNQDNMNNNLIPITPGHYQSNASRNSETPKIVRVLGIDPNTEGRWLCNNGKVVSLSDYELKQDYFRLAMVATKNETTVAPPLSIFAGIGDVYDESEEAENNDIPDEPVYSDNFRIVSPAQTNIVFPEPVAKQNMHDPLILSILDKCAVSSGSIDFSLNVSIDKNKLIASIGMFELSKDACINAIVDRLHNTDIIRQIAIQLVTESMPEPKQVPVPTQPMIIEQPTHISSNGTALPLVVPIPTEPAPELISAVNALDAIINKLNTNQ